MCIFTKQALNMFEIPFLKFTIIYDLQPFVLSHAPDGWQGAGFGSGLDDFFKTNLKKVKADLSFIHEGAHKLRKIFYKNGATAKASLRIEKLNTDTFLYEEKVFADFDFNDWDDTGYEVKITLKENSVMANIRSCMDTVYTIPVDQSTNAVPVNIGGIGVGEGATFIAALQATGFGGFNAFLPSLTLQDSTVIGTTIVELNSDYDSATIFLGDTSVLSYNWFMKVNAPTNFNLRLTGKIEATGAGLTLNQKFTFLIYDDLDRKYPLGNVFFTGYKLHESALQLSFDVNIPVETGRTYTIAMFSPRTNVGADTYSMQIDTLQMKIDYSTYTVDYHALGLRAFDLFKQLMYKMNPNSSLSISSNLLSFGEWYRLVILSGDCIRGIPGATINTSFRDFFASMSATLFAGFKVYDDNSIRLEDRTYFFDKNANAGDLGELSSVHFKSTKGFNFAKITAGYTDQEYNKTQGKDEFNTEVVFTSFINDNNTQSNNFVNPIEIKSPYRADPRGVDQLILDYRQDPTKDNRGDKEIFMLQIKEVLNGEGYYDLEGVERYLKVEGVSALGRIYNLNLSPRHMLYRSSPILAVPFALNQQGGIQFESSKKNSGLKITDLDGSVFLEKGPMSYQDMRPPIYLPIELTATLAVTDTKYNSIIANAQASNGYVTATFKSKKYKLFIVGDSFNLTHDNKKEFNFYLSPDSILPV